MPSTVSPFLTTRQRATATVASPSNARPEKPTVALPREELAPIRLPRRIRPSKLAVVRTMLSERQAAKDAILHVPPVVTPVAPVRGPLVSVDAMTAIFAIPPPQLPPVPMQMEMQMSSPWARGGVPFHSMVLRRRRQTSAPIRFMRIATLIAFAFLVGVVVTALLGGGHLPG